METSPAESVDSPLVTSPNRPPSPNSTLRSYAGSQLSDENSPLTAVERLDDTGSVPNGFEDGDLSSNMVPAGNSGGRTPPSPLCGGYLLIVIGEPQSEAHKTSILQRLTKAFYSWNRQESNIDIEHELGLLVSLSPEGEVTKTGERLIQNASEYLVTEILINPQINTMKQCIRNLLSSFTKYRYIIHAGYAYSGTGSWILQDGTFSVHDFIEAFQELEVQRVIKAYQYTIKTDVICNPEGQWHDSRISQEAFSKICQVAINPGQTMTPGNVTIRQFVDYLEPLTIPSTIQDIMQPSEVVGNIRFSHPTLYVFPGGEGDAALFGINGFNMLVDGGFDRRACFWNFVRHLDRLDAVLYTGIKSGNIGGITSILERKVYSHVYPQIGHFFSNLQPRRHLPSPGGNEDKNELLVNLIDKGDEIVMDLKRLQLKPHHCYKDPNMEPVNLYHKVGHGKLDMYIISPTKDSHEVKEFLNRWQNSDVKLFRSSATKGQDIRLPLQNLVSICALLVWQPANMNERITRILFPGSAPQWKIFEGLQKLKSFEFMKHPTCTPKSILPLQPRIAKPKLKVATSEKVDENRFERKLSSETKVDSPKKAEEPKRTVRKPKRKIKETTAAESKMVGEEKKAVEIKKIEKEHEKMNDEKMYDIIPTTGEIIKKDFDEVGYEKQELEELTSEKKESEKFEIKEAEMILKSEMKESEKIEIEKGQLELKQTEKTEQEQIIRERKIDSDECKPTEMIIDSKSETISEKSEPVAQTESASKETEIQQAVEVQQAKVVEEIDGSTFTCDKEVKESAETEKQQSIDRIDAKKTVEEDKIENEIDKQIIVKTMTKEKSLKAVPKLSQKDIENNKMKSISKKDQEPSKIQQKVTRKVSQKDAENLKLKNKIRNDNIIESTKPKTKAVERTVPKKLVSAAEKAPGDIKKSETPKPIRKPTPTSKKPTDISTPVPAVVSKKAVDATPPTPKKVVDAKSLQTKTSRPYKPSKPVPKSVKDENNRLVLAESKPKPVPRPKKEESVTETKLTKTQVKKQQSSPVKSIRKPKVEKADDKKKKEVKPVIKPKTLNVKSPMVDSKVQDVTEIMKEVEKETQICKRPETATYISSIITKDGDEEDEILIVETTEIKQLTPGGVEVSKYIADELESEKEKLIIKEKYDVESKTIVSDEVAQTQPPVSQLPTEIHPTVSEVTEESKMVTKEKESPKKDIIMAKVEKILEESKLKEELKQAKTEVDKEDEFVDEKQILHLGDQGLAQRLDVTEQEKTSEVDITAEKEQEMIDLLNEQIIPSKKHVTTKESAMKDISQEIEKHTDDELNRATEEDKENIITPLKDIAIINKGLIDDEVPEKLTIEKEEIIETLKDDEIRRIAELDVSKTNEEVYTKQTSPETITDVMIPDDGEKGITKITDDIQETYDKSEEEKVEAKSKLSTAERIIDGKISPIVAAKQTEVDSVVVSAEKKEDKSEIKVDIPEDAEKVVTKLTPEEKDILFAEVDGIITTAKELVTAGAVKEEEFENAKKVVISISDEKLSTIESNSTTAPTMPEDEKVDDIEEIQEKHDLEDTKEKKPQLSYPKRISLEKEIIEATTELMRAKDAVKTPDEVADLPVHEEVDDKTEKMKTDSKQTDVEGYQEKLKLSSGETAFLDTKMVPDTEKDKESVTTSEKAPESETSNDLSLLRTDGPLDKVDENNETPPSDVSSGIQIHSITTEELDKEESIEKVDKPQILSGDKKILRESETEEVEAEKDKLLPKTEELSIVMFDAREDASKPAEYELQQPILETIKLEHAEVVTLTATPSPDEKQLPLLEQIESMKLLSDEVSPKKEKEIFAEQPSSNEKSKLEEKSAVFQDIPQEITKLDLQIDHLQDKIPSDIKDDLDKVTLYVDDVKHQEIGKVVDSQIITQEKKKIEDKVSEQKIPSTDIGSINLETDTIKDLRDAKADSLHETLEVSDLKKKEEIKEAMPKDKEVISSEDESSESIDTSPKEEAVLKLESTAHTIPLSETKHIKIPEKDKEKDPGQNEQAILGKFEPPEMEKVSKITSRKEEADAQLESSTETKHLKIPEKDEIRDLGETEQAVLDKTPEKSPEKVETKVLGHTEDVILDKLQTSKIKKLSEIPVQKEESDLKQEAPAEIKHPELLDINEIKDLGVAGQEVSDEFNTSKIEQLLKEDTHVKEVPSPHLTVLSESKQSEASENDIKDVDDMEQTDLAKTEVSEVKKLSETLDRIIKDETQLEQEQSALKALSSPETEQPETLEKDDIIDQEDFKEVVQEKSGISKVTKLPETMEKEKDAIKDLRITEQTVPDTLETYEVQKLSETPDLSIGKETDLKQTPSPHKTPSGDLKETEITDKDKAGLGYTEQTVQDEFKSSHKSKVAESSDSTLTEETVLKQEPTAQMTSLTEAMHPKTPENYEELSTEQTEQAVPDKPDTFVTKKFDEITSGKDEADRKSTEIKYPQILEKVEIKAAGEFEKAVMDKTTDVTKLSDITDISLKKEKVLEQDKTGQEATFAELKRSETSVKVHFKELGDHELSIPDETETSELKKPSTDSVATATDTSLKEEPVVKVEQQVHKIPSPETKQPIISESGDIEQVASVKRETVETKQLSEALDISPKEETLLKQLPTTFKAPSPETKEQDISEKDDIKDQEDDKQAVLDKSEVSEITKLSGTIDTAIQDKPQPEQEPSARKIPSPETKQLETSKMDDIKVQEHVDKPKMSEVTKLSETKDTAIQDKTQLGQKTSSHKISSPEAKQPETLKKDGTEDEVEVKQVPLDKSEVSEVSKLSETMDTAIQDKTQLGQKTSSHKISSPEAKQPETSQKDGTKDEVEIKQVPLDKSEVYEVSKLPETMDTAIQDKKQPGQEPPSHEISSSGIKQPKTIEKGDIKDQKDTILDKSEISEVTKVSETMDTAIQEKRQLEKEPSSHKITTPETKEPETLEKDDIEVQEGVKQIKEEPTSHEISSPEIKQPKTSENDDIKVQEGIKQVLLDKSEVSEVSKLPETMDTAIQDKTQLGQEPSSPKMLSPETVLPETLKKDDIKGQKDAILDKSEISEVTKVSKTMDAIQEKTMLEQEPFSHKITSLETKVPETLEKDDIKGQEGVKQIKDEPHKIPSSETKPTFEKDIKDQADVKQVVLDKSEISEVTKLSESIQDKTKFKEEPTSPKIPSSETKHPETLDKDDIKDQKDDILEKSELSEVTKVSETIDTDLQDKTQSEKEPSSPKIPSSETKRPETLDKDDIKDQKDDILEKSELSEVTKVSETIDTDLQDKTQSEKEPSSPKIPSPETKQPETLKKDDIKDQKILEKSELSEVTKVSETIDTDLQDKTQSEKEPSSPKIPSSETKRPETLDKDDIKDQKDDILEKSELSEVTKVSETIDTDLQDKTQSEKEPSSPKIPSPETKQPETLKKDDIKDQKILEKSEISEATKISETIDTDLQDKTQSEKEPSSPKIPSPETKQPETLKKDDIKDQKDAILEKSELSEATKISETIDTAVQDKMKLEKEPSSSKIPSPETKQPETLKKDDMKDQKDAILEKSELSEATKISETIDTAVQDKMQLEKEPSSSKIPSPETKQPETLKKDDMKDQKDAILEKSELSEATKISETIDTAVQDKMQLEKEPSSSKIPSPETKQPETLGKDDIKDQKDAILDKSEILEGTKVSGTMDTAVQDKTRLDEEPSSPKIPSPTKQPKTLEKDDIKDQKDAKQVVLDKPETAEVTKLSETIDTAIQDKMQLVQDSPAHEIPSAEIKQPETQNVVLEDAKQEVLDKIEISEINELFVSKKIPSSKTEHHKSPEDEIKDLKDTKQPLVQEKSDTELSLETDHTLLKQTDELKEYPSNQKTLSPEVKDLKTPEKHETTHLKEEQPHEEDVRKKELEKDEPCDHEKESSETVHSIKIEENAEQAAKEKSDKLDKLKETDSNVSSVIKDAIESKVDVHPKISPKDEIKELKETEGVHDETLIPEIKDILQKSIDEALSHRMLAEIEHPITPESDQFKKDQEQLKSTDTIKLAESEVTSPEIMTKEEPSDQELMEDKKTPDTGGIKETRGTEKQPVTDTIISDKTSPVKKVTGIEDESSRQKLQAGETEELNLSEKDEIKKWTSIKDIPDALETTKDTIPPGVKDFKEHEILSEKDKVVSAEHDDFHETTTLETIKLTGSNDFSKKGVEDLNQEHHEPLYIEKEQKELPESYALKELDIMKEKVTPDKAEIPEAKVLSPKVIESKEMLSKPDSSPVDVEHLQTAHKDAIDLKGMKDGRDKSEISGTKTTELKDVVDIKEHKIMQPKTDDQKITETKEATLTGAKIYEDKVPLPDIEHPKITEPKDLSPIIVAKTEDKLFGQESHLVEITAEKEDVKDLKDAKDIHGKPQISDTDGRLQKDVEDFKEHEKIKQSKTAVAEEEGIQEKPQTLLTVDKDIMKVQSGSVETGPEKSGTSLARKLPEHKESASIDVTLEQKLTSAEELKKDEINKIKDTVDAHEKVDSSETTVSPTKDVKDIKSYQTTLIEGDKADVQEKLQISESIKLSETKASSDLKEDLSDHEQSSPEIKQSKLSETNETDNLQDRALPELTRKLSEMKESAKKAAELEKEPDDQTSTSVKTDHLKTPEKQEQQECVSIHDKLYTQTEEVRPAELEKYIVVDTKENDTQVKPGSPETIKLSESKGISTVEQIKDFGTATAQTIIDESKTSAPRKLTETEKLKTSEESRIKDTLDSKADSEKLPLETEAVSHKISGDFKESTIITAEIKHLKSPKEDETKTKTDKEDSIEEKTKTMKIEIVSDSGEPSLKIETDLGKGVSDQELITTEIKPAKTSEIEQKVLGDESQAVPGKSEISRTIKLPETTDIFLEKIKFDQKTPEVYEMKDQDIPKPKDASLGAVTDFKKHEIPSDEATPEYDVPRESDGSDIQEEPKNLETITLSEYKDTLPAISTELKVTSDVETVQLKSKEIDDVQQEPKVSLETKDVSLDKVDELESIKLDQESAPEVEPLKKLEKDESKDEASKGKDQSKLEIIETKKSSDVEGVSPKVETGLKQDLPLCKGPTESTHSKPLEGENVLRDEVKQTSEVKPKETDYTKKPFEIGDSSSKDLPYFSKTSTDEMKQSTLNEYDDKTIEVEVEALSKEPKTPGTKDSSEIKYEPPKDLKKSVDHEIQSSETNLLKSLDNSEALRSTTEQFYSKEKPFDGGVVPTDIKYLGKTKTDESIVLSDTVKQSEVSPSALTDSGISKIKDVEINDLKISKVVQKKLDVLEFDDVSPKTVADTKTEPRKSEVDSQKKEVDLLEEKAFEQKVPPTDIKSVTTEMNVQSKDSKELLELKDVPKAISDLKEDVILEMVEHQTTKEDEKHDQLLDINVLSGSKDSLSKLTGPAEELHDHMTEKANIITTEEEKSFLDIRTKISDEIHESSCITADTLVKDKIASEEIIGSKESFPKIVTDVKEKIYVHDIHSIEVKQSTPEKEDITDTLADTPKSSKTDGTPEAKYELSVIVVDHKDEPSISEVKSVDLKKFVTSIKNEVQTMQVELGTTETKTDSSCLIETKREPLAPVGTKGSSDLMEVKSTDSEDQAVDVKKMKSKKDETMYVTDFKENELAKVKPTEVKTSEAIPELKYKPSGDVKTLTDVKHSMTSEKGATKDSIEIIEEVMLKEPKISEATKVADLTQESCDYITTTAKIKQPLTETSSAQKSAVHDVYEVDKTKASETSKLSKPIVITKDDSKVFSEIIEDSTKSDLGKDKLSSQEISTIEIKTSEPEEKQVSDSEKELSKIVDAEKSTEIRSASLKDKADEKELSIRCAEKTEKDTICISPDSKEQMVRKKEDIAVVTESSGIEESVVAKEKASMEETPLAEIKKSVTFEHVESQHLGHPKEQDPKEASEASQLSGVCDAKSKTEAKVTSSDLEIYDIKDDKQKEVESSVKKTSAEIKDESQIDQAKETSDDQKIKSIITKQSICDSKEQVLAEKLETKDEKIPSETKDTVPKASKEEDKLSVESKSAVYEAEQSELSEKRLTSRDVEPEMLLKKLEISNVKPVDAGLPEDAERFIKKEFEETVMDDLSTPDKEEGLEKRFEHLQLAGEESDGTDSGIVLEKSIKEKSKIDTDKLVFKDSVKQETVTTSPILIEQPKEQDHKTETETSFKTTSHTVHEKQISSTEEYKEYTDKATILSKEITVEARENVMDEEISKKIVHEILSERKTTDTTDDAEKITKQYDSAEETKRESNKNVIETNEIESKLTTIEIDAKQTSVHIKGAENDTYETKEVTGSQKAKKEAVLKETDDVSHEISNLIAENEKLLSGRSTYKTSSETDVARQQNEMDNIIISTSTKDGQSSTLASDHLTKKVIEQKFDIASDETIQSTNIKADSYESKPEFKKVIEDHSVTMLTTTADVHREDHDITKSGSDSASRASKQVEKVQEKSFSEVSEIKTSVMYSAATEQGKVTPSQIISEQPTEIKLSSTGVEQPDTVQHGTDSKDVIEQDVADKCSTSSKTLESKEVSDEESSSGSTPEDVKASMRSIQDVEDSAADKGLLKYVTITEEEYMELLHERRKTEAKYEAKRKAKTEKKDKMETSDSNLGKTTRHETLKMSSVTHRMEDSEMEFSTGKIMMPESSDTILQKPDTLIESVTATMSTVGDTRAIESLSPELHLDTSQLCVKFSTEKTGQKKSSLMPKSHSVDAYELKTGQTTDSSLSSNLEKKEVSKTVSLPVLDEKFESIKTESDVEVVSKSLPLLETCNEDGKGASDSLSTKVSKTQSVSLPFIKMAEESDKYMTLPHLYKTHNLEDLSAAVKDVTIASKELESLDERLVDDDKPNVKSAVCRDSEKFDSTIGPITEADEVDDELQTRTNIEAGHDDDKPYGGRRPSTPPSEDVSLEQLSNTTQHSDNKPELQGDSDDDIADSTLSSSSIIGHLKEDEELQDQLATLQEEAFRRMSSSMTQSFYGTYPDDENKAASTNDDSPSVAEVKTSSDEKKETKIKDSSKPASAKDDSQSGITEVKTESSDEKEETKIKDSSKPLDPKTESKDPIKDWGKPLGLPSIKDMNSVLIWNPLEQWGNPLGLPSPTTEQEPDNKTIENMLATGTPKKTGKKAATTTVQGRDLPKTRESPANKKLSKINPIYIDLAYVPHHGNSQYSNVDFFKTIRARYYVFSGTDPSKEVFDALLEAKKSWDNQELEVTIIPTYDTDALGYWLTENEDALTKLKIDLSPSASRCTINLQDHDTSCSAYRLEF